MTTTAQERDQIALRAQLYREHGAIAGMVVPKGTLPARFRPGAAEALVAQGALRVYGTPDAEVQLLAVGAYQLGEALRAARRLEARGTTAAVVYLLEPGRFRRPRDAREGSRAAPPELSRDLFPGDPVRVILSHTRPEPMLGLLRPLDTGRHRTRALGYANRGGTLDTFGMLFANRCTWAHAVVEAAEALQREPESFLSAEELAAVLGQGDPRALA